MADLRLDMPVQYVKGVGPTRAAQLAQLGIATLEDLLMYFPRRFDLRRQAQPIGTLRGDEPSVTVAGQILEVEDRPRARRPYLQLTIEDGSGWVYVKWFHGGYLRDRLKSGLHIAISGKVTRYKECPQFINPRLQILYDPAGTRLDQDELLPVYPAGAGLTSGIIANVIRKVLPTSVPLVREWFDKPFLVTHAFTDRPSAVAAMHRPEDKEHWQTARRRMAYEECFLMQLGLALIRMRQVSRPAHPLESNPTIDRRIRARFPFRLTAAQDRAVAEIAADLGRSRPMNRLLQGDVGSGKTVVALYAALLAVAHGKQAAIMAPTEILAAQHFEKVRQYLQGSKVRTERLVGSQSRAERSAVLEGLADGSVNLVIGTHAMLSEKVNFHHLALVVVDEQHKFGVRQRTGIRGKGHAPHYLVMTATPIPRTLAMTVFGDLDVSVIDELPPGRGRITTRVVSQDELPEVYARLRDRLAAGQQAYVVCPVVNPTAEGELTAAREASESLAAGPLKDFRVGLIHGQMPADRKEAVMREFHRGDIAVLVASVVVEVGVDVPTANVMIVLHAERFGLAQLHQLRGRIGRGGGDAECILAASPGNPVSQERLAVLTKTRDGFKIAEEDLRLRGPGEMFGTRQHGLPELKVADLAEDFDLLRLARRDAFAMVKDDPDLGLPHHQVLRAEVIRAYGGRLGLATGA